MIQTRHVLCTWWLSNIKRKLQNHIHCCLCSLGSRINYLLQLNLSNFKLPIKIFQMHHAPGCLKLKTTLRVCQVLFCNFVLQCCYFYCDKCCQPLSIYTPWKKEKTKQNKIKKNPPSDSSFLTTAFCSSSGCTVLRHLFPRGGWGGRECLHVAAPDKGRSARGSWKWPCWCLACLAPTGAALSISPQNPDTPL